MRALLFDLDNTLIDRDDALKQALLQELGSSDTVRKLMQLDAGGYGSREVFLNSWSTMSGSVRTMQHLGAAISDNLQPDVQLLTALEAISERVMLGIISNGGVENQLAKIQSAGLANVISNKNLWISGGLPFAKPDREIFQLACKSLNVCESEALFVGDHPVIDIQGALKAGLHAQQVTQVVDAEFIDGLAERIHA